MSKELVMVKLLGGGDLLGEVEKDDGDKLVINNPVFVVLGPPKQGSDKPTLSFEPLLIFSDQKDPQIPLSKSAIVFGPYTPAKQIQDSWRQMFGSGLIIPQSSLITPSS